MNKFIHNFLKAVILTAIFSSAVHAEHDNGQGKSQDDPLGSVSVAPEPSTFWLFLSGTLMIAAYGRYRKKQDSE